MCKEKPPLFVCGTCKNQSYCSETCQKLHWPLHESDCKDDSIAMLEEIEKDLLEEPIKMNENSAAEMPGSRSEAPISAPETSTSSSQLSMLQTKRDQKEVDSETGTSAEFFEKTDKKNSTKCLGCHEKDPKYLCATCNNAWYCCLVCQEKHWDFHQSECES